MDDNQRVDRLQVDEDLNFQRRSWFWERVGWGMMALVLQPLRDRMNKVRIEEGAILAAARELQGLERMDQIKYAVLESMGTISVVPQQGEGS